MNGRDKKGVANFSENMTYIEAVSALQKINVEKAIGLDTGIYSEAYFYDDSGKPYLMVDEKMQNDKLGYTNVFVMYSEQK